MAYIGKSPGTGVRNRFIYTATAGQTTFSGSDDHSRTLSYTDAEFTDVFLNGVKLDKSDYTATSGTSIVLGSAASLNDILEVLAFDTFSVFSGDFSQDVTIGADLTVDTDTLVVDSANNRVGVGTVSPTASLEISGSDDSNNLIVGHNDTDFAVYNDSTVGEVRLKAEDGSGSNFAKFMTFYTQPSGSAAAERLRILSSGGLTFNGDTAAANALDDYEEGTWSPTYFGGTTAGTTSYSLRNGTYTKIGNLVHATAIIGVSSATGTGNAKIGGLPFTSLSQGSGHYPPLNWSYNNGISFTSGYQLAGYVARNSTEIVLSQFNSSGAVGGVPLDSSFTEIDFSVTYHTA